MNNIVEMLRKSDEMRQKMETRRRVKPRRYKINLGNCRAYKWMNKWLHKVVILNGFIKLLNMIETEKYLKGKQGIKVFMELPLRNGC